MDKTTGDTGDHAYFAQRAAEELERSLAATDDDAAKAHRRLQRAYLEKASVGNREGEVQEEAG